MIFVQSFAELDSHRWNEIMTLRSEVFVTEQKCVYTDPDEMDTKALHISIIDREFLAYARLINLETWYIGRVIVHKNARGRGLGRHIMNACLDHIKSIDSSAKIELSAQLYLSNFYSSLGFKAIGSMYLEDGIPHMKMVYSPLVKTPV